MSVSGEAVMVMDWPEPIEVLNEDGASPIVLLCEHASHHVPAAYDRMGLSEAELLRHIGWDIGAADVTRRLAGLLDAPAFLGAYSRLLVDLNRPIGVPSSMPLRSERTDIPANAALTPAEIDRRLARIFTPFHARVAAHLDRRSGANRPTRLVTIHSFTPVFMDVSRPWHCGILFNRSEAYTATLIRRLQADPSLIVAPNVPYQITQNEDYAIPVHGEARGLDAVLVEIRHDLIATRDDADAWADRLAAALAD